MKGKCWEAAGGEAVRYGQPRTPFLRALDTLRREATRQGEYREHVATVFAMVDQYAEAALGDRHYFCEQPYVLQPAKPIS